MTHIMETGDNVLGLLSRSRRSAAVTPNTVETTVIRLSQLRAEQGPALAVLKVARDVRGATTLRTQRRMVAEVSNQPGLEQEWRELLPRFLSFTERADATVCVESYRPGTSLAAALATDASHFEELVALALDAIAPLHRATARSIVADRLSSVRQWVVEPATNLAQICGRRSPGLMPALGHLEETLTRAISGRRMTVCWTHGAYTPESVLLAAPRGQVNRIVGWDEARGDRPALVDTYLMVLAASCQAHGVDLGPLVSQRLAAGGLTDSERHILVGAADRTDGVDERVAMLLAWLQHTAALCRKGSEQSNDDGWWALQVVPVLEAVDEWGGAEGPQAPAPNVIKDTSYNQ